MKSFDYVKKSVERTTRWGRARLNGPTLSLIVQNGLFELIQGVKGYKELRQQSAKGTCCKWTSLAIPIGGLSSRRSLSNQ